MLTTRRPDFDSPSVFCRLLDKDKGGYFSIAPRDPASCTTKQQYLPSSAILQTRYIHEDGVADVVDFFPRPKKSAAAAAAAPAPAPSWSSAGAAGRRHSAYRRATGAPQDLKQWLVRRVACIRGELTLGKLATLIPSLSYYSAIAYVDHVCSKKKPPRRTMRGTDRLGALG